MDEEIKYHVEVYKVRLTFFGKTKTELVFCFDYTISKHNIFATIADNGTLYFGEKVCVAPGEWSFYIAKTKDDS